MKLNLGCGSHVPGGWINVDYALGARCARIPFFRSLNKKLRVFAIDWDHRIVVHDLRKPFPWGDDCADVIYISHLLEHFTRDEGRTFLARCSMTLRQGGIIRVIVPDLHHVVREYSEGRLRADAFVEELGVLYHQNVHPVKNLLAPLVQFPHRCMYDAATLLDLLREMGISAVRRPPLESDIENIQAIELSSRTENAVIVEGTNTSRPVSETL